MALVNVLRREGCPLTVTSEDGKTTYVEGKDFEPVRDPKLGMVPYEGEYEFDHPGAPLRMTSNSRIKDGDRLRVGWYHPVLVLGSYAACCLSEPKVYDLLRDQARRVDALYHPKTFFMQHDEMRVANWCKACQARKLTPGQLLADNARRCTQIIEEVHPGAKAVVWSDMFDPTHNAVKDYYLVNGTLEGSWEGLAPSVIIANWNGGKAKASLDFFAKRGHQQIMAGLLRFRRQLRDLGRRLEGRARRRRVHVHHLAEPLRRPGAIRQGVDEREMKSPRPMSRGEREPDRQIVQADA